VVGVALYDFHPDAFAVPVSFGVALALVRRRWGLYGGLLLALLAVKDTAGVVLLGLAVVCLVQRRWLVAAATAVAGLAGLAVDARLLLPALGQAVISQWPSVYGYLGPTPQAGVAHLAAHPWLLVAPFAHLRSWEYLVWMVGPLVLFAVGGGRRILNRWWLPALAVLEMNLLGHVASLSSPFDEFAVWAVPFLFIAALDALAGEAPPTVSRASRFALPVAAIFFVVFAGQQVHSFWLNGPPNQAALAAAVRRIPPAAPVAAQDFVLPHVSDRIDAWHLAALLAGTRFPAGTYVLLDRRASDAIDAAALPIIANRLQTPGQATPVFSTAGVELYRLDQTLSGGA
jgi:hypothetical protein